MYFTATECSFVYDTDNNYLFKVNSINRGRLDLAKLDISVNLAGAWIQSYFEDDEFVYMNVGKVFLGNCYQFNLMIQDVRTNSIIKDLGQLLPSVEAFVDVIKFLKTKPSSLNYNLSIKLIRKTIEKTDASIE